MKGQREKYRARIIKRKKLEKRERERERSNLQVIADIVHLF